MMSASVKSLACRIALSIGLSMTLSAAMAGSAQTIPDTMAQRMQPCSACHGREGRATPEAFFPRIAGKPAG